MKFSMPTLYRSRENLTTEQEFVYTLEQSFMKVLRCYDAQ